MYQMKNGILFRDEKPVFALGQSYYPSYHPQKVPFLPEDDRIAEMEKDLRGMKEAGFHLVRMAALGDVRLEAGEVKVQFDLPDAFCRMCESLDLASMVRLQGYSMNLRGFEDGDMVSAQGETMPFHWGWFIRSCLNHPGIYEDNEKGTVASAAHFADFPSVVSFQIYNEPAYPHEGFYDYHPATVAAYRVWLAEKGLAAEDPPTERPAAGMDPMPWVRFRMFLMERMTRFMCDMSDRAHEGYAGAETLTCHMSCPVTPGAAVRGEDYFDTAKGMDILGITSYLPHRGPSFHQAGLQLAMSESAAALYGKHTWIIEYNARTGMPPAEWERETYAAIGQGIKGILYYQWRADYPFADGPEPEGFGMLYNDGRRTAMFDTAVAMNRLIGRLGEEIVTARKARSGVAILYSHHQNAYTDATDNGDIANVRHCHEESILSLRALYTLLSQRSLPVDFLRAEDLQANPLDARTLLIPTVRGLPEAELDQIEAFSRSGGAVYAFQRDLMAFVPFVRNEVSVLHGVLIEQYDLGTLLEVARVTPPASVSGHSCVDARILHGDGYALCVLTNYDPLERKIENAVLQVHGVPYGTATAFALGLPEEGLPLAVEGGKVILPTLHYGAIIRLS